MDVKQKLIQNTSELLELKKKNSLQVFYKSLPLFSLSRRREALLIIVLIMVFLVLKLLLFPNNYAVKIIADLTVNLNAIIIPLFTVIVTGYAIFQALANGKTLITLITVKHQDKSSKFEVYNLYFFGIGMWYLVLIVLNFLLLFLFRYMPEDWYLQCFSVQTNEIISAILISIYVVGILNFLIEMKSFVFNLFQVFITNASSAAIEKLENENNREN